MDNCESEPLANNIICVVYVMTSKSLHDRWLQLTSNFASGCTHS